MALRNFWPVILFAVGLIVAMLLMFVGRLPSPAHPFWCWFGIMAGAGLLLGRWSALWVALIPSVMLLAFWLVLVTIGRSSSSSHSQGDFGLDIVFAIPIIGAILALIGFWGVLMGLALRGAFHWSVEL